MRRRRALTLVTALVCLLGTLPVAADEPPATEVEVVPAPEPLDETPDYDPWQRFNECTFAFNYRVLDRFVMKPLGRAWDWLLPDQVQRSLDNAFKNLEMPKRLVNEVLQARPRAAGEEVCRFVVNTTVGVVGFFDVASRLGLHGRDTDTGQTFGVWGIGPGPYLVLPFLPPLTVRDGIGYGVDGALDPIGYIATVPLPASLAVTVVRRVNDRSLQPAVFENIEETVIDLYSSVRNGYLQRRRHAIRQARKESMCRGRPSPPEP